MTFDREKHCFIAVDPKTREQLHVPIDQLGQMVVKEVEKIEITSPPTDLAPIRQELSQKIAAVFQAMHTEFERRIQQAREQILRDAIVSYRRTIDALTVASVLAENSKAIERGESERPIEPGQFPALEQMLMEQGEAVTPEAIIAAAKEHTRREHAAVKGAV